MTTAITRTTHRLASIDDLWRRADVPVAWLVQLAEANAMNESMGLARRGKRYGR